MRLKVYNNHNIKSNNNNTIPITCIINKTNEHETINNTNVIVNEAEKVNEAACAAKQIRMKRNIVVYSVGVLYTFPLSNMKDRKSVV